MFDRFTNDRLWCEALDTLVDFCHDTECEFSQSCPVFQRSKADDLP